MVSNTVWLNGRLVSHARARLGIDDAGFLFGDGIFETVAARGGHLIAVQRHWHRMVHACRVMDLHTVSPDEFEAALWAVLGCSGLRDARLRFSISRGVGSRQTFLATAAEMPDYSKPETVCLSPYFCGSKGPLTGIKSLSYAAQLMMRREAQRQGCGEALVRNESNELCEATTSNVFVVIGGRLCTPPLRSGCLPGVMRGVVIEACANDGLQVEERPLSWGAMTEVEEAFLTSSLRGVQPIGCWQGRPLRAPGALTQRASAACGLALEAMRSETGV